MEPVAAITEGEWSSDLSGMYTTEEADFMAQLLNNCSLPNELDVGSNLGLISSTFSPAHESTTMDMAGGVDEGLLYFSDAANSSSYCFSLGSSSYSGGYSGYLFSNNSSNESYYPSDCHQIFTTNTGSMSMDFGLGDEENIGPSVQPFADNVMEVDDECLNRVILSDGNVEESGGNLAEDFLSTEILQQKKEPEMPLPDQAVGTVKTNPVEIPKKRSRNSNVQKNKRSVKPRKSLKLVSVENNKEENNCGLNRQSSSSCSSEDDDSTNTSQELNGETSNLRAKGAAAALNSSGKTRASRGSATDPQSLYARKRRERINERLRILQSLVPNGTKVDISTMLEEAVQYVKFLQLQIKLLSSDDLWMYAPLAYNGMDIGLDLKITMPNNLGR